MSRTEGSWSRIELEAVRYEEELVMNPYRDLEVKVPRKLARRRAYLRGLYRRVILPTKVVAGFCAAGLIFNVCAWDCTRQGHENEKARASRHWEDWEASIRDKQQRADQKFADAEQKERDLNTRVRSFEDVMSISSALLKDSDSKNVLPEMLKRSGVKKE